MMSIFESLENLNVSEECFDDIMGIIEELLNEKVTHSTLHTGHPEREDNKFIVTSNHDNGVHKTTVHADSADQAIDAVNRQEGGPRRAHQVLVKDNPERTAEAVKKQNSKVVGVGIGHGETAQTPTLKKLGVDKLKNKKISEALIKLIEGYVARSYKSGLGNSNASFKTPKEAENWVKNQKLDYKKGDSYEIHGGDNTSELKGLHSYGGDNGYWGRAASGNELTKGTKWHKPTSQEYKDQVSKYRKDI